MELTKAMAKSTYERYFFIKVNKGFSDSEMARRTGLTRSLFSNWKAGKSMPKIETLFKISQVLGCHVTDIIGGWDENTCNRACNG